MFSKYSKLRKIGKVAAVVTAVTVISACGSDDDDSTSSTTPAENTDPTDPTDPTGTGGETTTAGAILSPDMFVAGALASSEIIDCTLSDGTASTCYELVTAAVEKTTDQMGPFCPSSAAEEGGVWLDGESFYDVNGDFFLDLPNIYGDLYPPAESWNFYEDDGTLRVVTTLEGCRAAARPNVDVEYQSYCVQCALEDLDVADVVLTFTIPTTPVPADSVGELADTAGISLNGFQMASEAPVEDILSNWTIAAFDECGGHVNPMEGYHFHASTGADGCNSAGTDSNGHPELMGFAMDGYGIYGTLAVTDAEASALDECNGTSDDTHGYHYHAGEPALNQHIGCYYGLTVEGGGGGSGRGGGGPPE